MTIAKRLCSRAAQVMLSNKSERLSRCFSSNGAGAKPPLTEQTAAGSKLFENIRAPMEEAAAAASVGGAEAAAGMEAVESSGIGRTVARIGNTIFLGGLAAGSYLGYLTYKYDVDQVHHMVEETKKDENTFPGSQLWIQAVGWYADKREYIEGEFKKYADPPSDRLLPDLPPHARHIKTLVLDLDDVLVHSDWTRGRGWRTFKRPGVEDFVRDMAQYYELVVYTSQLPTYADPILDRIDPQRMIQYRLYRDSTQYVHGKHVRDLSKLNRDLKQVLLVTADKDAYALQPDNAIKLDKWSLEKPNDTALLDLLPFLEAIVRTNVTDVRDVVKSYEGQDVPNAFRERMKRVQEQQAQRTKSGKGFLGGIGGTRQ